MADQNKKNEILKAAAKIFAHYGYAKTTLDDIGKLVGLNKASLYYYYKNKESIFIEVIGSEINEFLTNIIEKISTMENCKAKILTYLSEFFKYSENTVNLHKLTIENFQTIRPVFNELFEDITARQVDHITNIIEHSVEKGELAACDAERVALSIITVAQAIKNKKINCNDFNLAAKIDFASIENEVSFTVSLILDGLSKNPRYK